VYYLNQAGRELTTPGIGTVYSAPLYLQRGHGISNFFCSLFRWIPSLHRSEAKAVGRETLRPGGKILTDIESRKSSINVSAVDRVSKHLTKTAQNFISKLRGQGRKRALSQAVRAKREKSGNKKY